MSLQNRVLPTSEIVAIPARGTMTGNRGIIHRDDQTLGTARWTHNAWICCTLDWQGRKRQVMTGRYWTELFFLDEAVALAAGHRPCAYCRREAYNSYVTAWEKAQGDPVRAPQMDRALHKARIIPRTRSQQTYRADLSDLPAGTFVAYRDNPHLVDRNRLFPYTPDGYGDPDTVSGSHTMTVLTPKPSVTCLRAGYNPALHASASR